MFYKLICSRFLGCDRDWPSGRYCEDGLTCKWSFMVTKHKLKNSIQLLLIQTVTNGNAEDFLLTCSTNFYGKLVFKSWQKGCWYCTLLYQFQKCKFEIGGYMLTCQLQYHFHETWSFLKAFFWVRYGKV